MLATPAPFPFVGSRGFLRDADKPAPVRIIRRNLDDTALIAVEERYRKASSNRTVAIADLFETEDEARPPLPAKPAGKTRPRRTAR